MRYLYISIALLLLSGSVMAQDLSKEEKKELMEQIKSMKKNPEMLKKLKQNVADRDDIIEEQIEEITILKNDLEKRNQEIAKLSDELQVMEANRIEAETKAAQFSPENYIPGDAPLDHDGTKYRIQIGLFKNLNITHLFDQPKYIVHENVNGMHRYSVGNFDSESDAEAFKLELRRLGIKDAFVTTYKDGSRIDDLPVSNVPSPKKMVIEPEPVKTGFNVKPSAQTPAKVNTHIESNPYPFQNGQVISSQPVRETQEEPAQEVQKVVVQPKPIYNQKEVERQVEEVKPAKIEQSPTDKSNGSGGIKIKVGD